MTGGATDDEKLELKPFGTAPTQAGAPVGLTGVNRSSSQDEDEKKPPVDKSEDSDSDTAQEDEVAFRLRELGQEDNPERFQGLKREHWW